MISRGVTTEQVIKRVNWVIRGWQGYFDNICMGKTRQSIKYYTEMTVIKFISKRKKKRRITYKIFEKRKLYDKFKLHEMKNLGQKFVSVHTSDLKICLRV